MGEWTEHIKEMEDGRYYALMEDSTGGVQEGIEAVCGFLRDRIQYYEIDLYAESQKGAASIGKMTVLRAFIQELNNIIDELSSILYVDHIHENIEVEETEEEEEDND